MTIDPTFLRELAPTGTIRAAINFGNPVLAQRDPTSGQPRGAASEIARELAHQTGLPLEFVDYKSPGEVLEGLSKNAWDIGFLAIDPLRATQIEFTVPYVILEGSYMVPVDSPLRSVEDFDKPGIRIAVALGSAYDLYLSRTIKSAQLVRHAANAEDLIAIFERERLEAVAGVKSPLLRYAATRPGLRVIDGRFMAIEQAMAVPKGTAHAAAYLNRLLTQLKQSGFIARALEQSGQGDAVVAPV